MAVDVRERKQKGKMLCVCLRLYLVSLYAAAAVQDAQPRGFPRYGEEEEGCSSEHSKI